MNSRKTNLNTERSESDFVRLLQEIKADIASSDLLLEHPVFQSRLRLITMAYASTTQDAEDLANDVSLKVWQNLRHFEPNYRRPYCGFFLWLRVVTRNSVLNRVLDTQPRHKVEFTEQRLEDLNIVDTHIDLEAGVLYKEVMTEFEKSLNALPDRERLATAFFLQGFTLREISSKLDNFSMSHLSVRNLIKKVLTTFFTKSGHLEDSESGNARITRARANKAKKEFLTIFEQAINSGTAAITPKDIYPTPITAFGRFGTSKSKQRDLRPGWQSANDLLKWMQSPESKQGIQAAFEASPRSLGQAAVELATKERKVPIGSLTSFLMVTSTVNVVGRVMNLSRDVA